MQKPIYFYKSQLVELDKKHTEISNRILRVRILRFTVFLATAIGIYYTFKIPNIPIIIGFVGITLFIFLVTLHQKLKGKRKIIETKKNINTIEIEVINGSYSELDTGKEFINPQHFFSNDIDLFGKGSFFQFINRTVTNDGKKSLAKTLSSNHISNISEKQKALQELSSKVKWRQHFSALESLVSAKKETSVIIQWIQNYTSNLPSFLSITIKVFPIISVVLIVLLILKIISFSVLLLWFFIGLGITASTLKTTQKLYTDANHAKDIFKQYYLLLEQIENQQFSSTILKEKQQEITSEDEKASVIFKKFSKILDAFDQRNNLIIAVVGNGLFLWDILNAIKTEKWIAQYKNVVAKWFETVSFFDAQNSLANFVYNHPNYAFPNIQKESKIIDAKNLGHPLLNSAKRIDNDFTIDTEQFFIITGANMAGKSTFLRTISLSIIMANCGLPVCAENYNYTPIKLITSMRTSDSLTDDESYFYSELKRLKFIVDEIANDNYFIVLDEILKGTNSKDKALGSKKFVEKLSKSNSTGIIATHDVSLCELAEEFSSQIENHYFDAEIINDELFFDYKMKKGVCKNMNASFLLKKMNIV
ncbi:DNA mismatch repair protein MutS [Tenacibaculum holothuriorum]|uniref:DNA mismatch repair protein MutS n=1 Tax=Tenacibaculum holothuriorum TaxID=1635173 RepID=A0A1Y2P9D0_9FLAO|nr:DNA mismatch repair protein MutS [Tenacibaculum holothuriorum]OSY87055.1 DNA mismatch repair protein MutS [Tenacibaculum holothuriorum]